MTGSPAVHRHCLPSPLSTRTNGRREPHAAAADTCHCLLALVEVGRLAAYGWRAARSLHAGGVNVAMADGRVTFIRDAIQPAVWRAVATRAGGETTDLDQR